MNQSLAQWRVSTVAELRHLQVQRSVMHLSMACSLLLEEVSSQHTSFPIFCACKDGDRRAPCSEVCGRGEVGCLQGPSLTFKRSPSNRSLPEDCQVTWVEWCRCGGACSR